MLKRILKVTALGIALLLIVLQFIGIDKTRPTIVESETLEAAVNVPADISFILSRSCNDCHSHKTVYPWYANIQPIGWFLKDHIKHGSERLNFSVFNTYSLEKKAKRLEEICEEIEAGGMPLPSYLWIHRDAVLSASEKNVICEWTREEAAKAIRRSAG
jgi:hypothetical protein